MLSDGNFRAFTRYKMSCNSSQYMRGRIWREESGFVVRGVVTKDILSSSTLDSFQKQNIFLEMWSPQL